MTDSALLQMIQQWLEHDDTTAINARLADLPDQDVAKLLAGLSSEEQARVIALLPEERSANVFSYLHTEQQGKLLQELDNTDQAALISELPYDDATALLEELPDEHSELLMGLLEPEDQAVLQNLLAWPEESAGRLMTPEFVAVRPDWTVEQALDKVRDWCEERETVNTVFVTSNRGQLFGTLSLKQLLLAQPERHIDSLLGDDLVLIEAHEDQEEVARLFHHYDLEVLPVVNGHGTLVGIITVDDILDVVEEETTEDFHKMGSVGVLNLSLRHASPSLLYRKRIGWLVILVLVNLLSGAAIAIFETAIEAVVALVFFLPLVIATGGNAGSQASTLMVRALATGDVQSRDWFRLWGKELGVSAALGITLGLAVWLPATWLGGSEIGSEVGQAVAIAMALVVVLGSMVGMLLPFILTRFKLDPATASGPLITSVADVVGILIYFSVATAILSVTLAT